MVSDSLVQGDRLGLAVTGLQDQAPGPSRAGELFEGGHEGTAGSVASRAAVHEDALDLELVAQSAQRRVADRLAVVVEHEHDLDDRGRVDREVLGEEGRGLVVERGEHLRVARGDLVVHRGAQSHGAFVGPVDPLDQPFGSRHRHDASITGPAETRGGRRNRR